MVGALVNRIRRKGGRVCLVTLEPHCEDDIGDFDGEDSASHDTRVVDTLATTPLHMNECPLMKAAVTAIGGRSKAGSIRQLAEKAGTSTTGNIAQ